MNKKFKLGAAGLATAALVALALVVPTAANAATSTAPVVGSGAGQTDEALYVLDPETGAPMDPSTPVSYGLAILGGPSSTDPLATFSAPTGGTQNAFTFISPRGQERDYTKWNAMSNIGVGSEQSLVAIGPSGQATTGQGNPAGTAAVAAAGGDYSLGVAWITGNLEIKKVAFTYITVTPGNIASTTFTFVQPAATVTEVAPAITAQPADTTVAAGASASFTAAASGTPAPTVKWQSSTDGSTWADVAGATSTTLTVANGVTGTQYRAIFTNSKGSATSHAATLTVTPAAPTAPTQPTGSDAGKVQITAPAKGATTVTLAAGTANKGKTLDVWAWSTPTKIGQVTTDASTGDAVVDITSLPAGEHTVALVQPGDASYAVVAWGTFEKLSASGDALSDTVDLTATVTASDLWALNAEKSAVDFGDVARGGTKTAALGKITVIDDRNVLKGWNLTASASDFTQGSQSIPASALTIAPAAFAGYTLPTGISAGTSGTSFASSVAQVSTGTTGALFDAGLTFTAPANAAAGVYHSTLTLTLTSK